MKKTIEIEVIEQPYIIIKEVAEQPDDEQFWSYPIEELPYIMERIKDGDFENGMEFDLYDGRLYETEETEVWQNETAYNKRYI